jgi:hypothetical protein
MKNTETIALSFILHQNQLKVDQRPQYKTWNFEKTPEEGRNALEQISLGNDFTNRTQKAQHLRPTMNKWDCNKLKTFCTAKETITRSWDSPHNGRKSLPATHLIRE